MQPSEHSDSNSPEGPWETSKEGFPKQLTGREAAQEAFLARVTNSLSISPNRPQVVVTPAGPRIAAWVWNTKVSLN